MNSIEVDFGELGDFESTEEVRNWQSSSGLEECQISLNWSGGLCLKFRLMSQV